MDKVLDFVVCHCGGDIWHARDGDDGGVTWEADEDWEQLIDYRYVECCLGSWSLAYTNVAEMWPYGLQVHWNGISDIVSQSHAPRRAVLMPHSPAHSGTSALSKPCVSGIECSSYQPGFHIGNCRIPGLTLVL